MFDKLPNWIYLLEKAGQHVNLGIGIDVEEVERWKNPKLKLDSLFTQQERAYCDSKAFSAEHYAGHWCAKEAVFKAVSPFANFSLRDVRITHRNTGEPIAEIDLQGMSFVQEGLRISISHSSHIAIALAVFVPSR